MSEGVDENKCSFREKSACIFFRNFSNQGRQKLTLLTFSVNILNILNMNMYI